jgi:hypothetical protein
MNVPPIGAPKPVVAAKLLRLKFGDASVWCYDSLAIKSKALIEDEKDITEQLDNANDLLSKPGVHTNEDHSRLAPSRRGGLF